MKALACAALAALLVSAQAGAATRPSGGELALMPLPATALGGQVSGLALAHDSGAVSNGEAANDASLAVTGAKLTSLGRITGYSLDYGGDTPLHGRIYQVQTGVELYRSEAAAGRGLAFWEKDEGDTSVMRAVGAHVSLARFPVPATLGAGSFGAAGTISMKGARTLGGADVDFRVGAVVGTVTVSGPGSSVAELRVLASRDATALRARIAAVLAGRVPGPPTPLPAKRRATPPAGGPNLEALALRPSDFTSARLSRQGYTLDSDLDPISEYERSMSPAGAFASFQQQVALFKDPTTAVFEMAALRWALTTGAGLRASGLNTGKSAYTPHVVPIEEGDDAFAALGVLREGRQKGVYVGYVVVRVGRVLVLTVIGTPTSVPLRDSAMAALGRASGERAVAGLRHANVA